MSPNVWLTVGMAVALIAFPLVSLGIAFWARMVRGANKGRPTDVDTTAPGRTIPGGDDYRP
jgi:hypothetical protein